MNPLNGTVAWLKPKAEIEDELPISLDAAACNHPCLIIDVQTVQSVQQARIFMVSALILRGHPAHNFRSRLSVERLAQREK